MAGQELYISDLPDTLTGAGTATLPPRAAEEYDDPAPTTPRGRRGGRRRERRPHNARRRRGGRRRRPHNARRRPGGRRRPDHQGHRRGGRRGARPDDARDRRGGLTAAGTGRPLMRPGIIGRPKDPQVRRVAHCLADLGAEPIVIDPSRFPGRASASIADRVPSCPGIDLAGVGAWYIRGLPQPLPFQPLDLDAATGSVDELVSTSRHAFAAGRERRSFLASFVAGPPAGCCSPASTCAGAMTRASRCSSAPVADVRRDRASHRCGTRDGRGGSPAAARRVSRARRQARRSRAPLGLDERRQVLTVPRTAGRDCAGVSGELAGAPATPRLRCARSRQR